MAGQFQIDVVEGGAVHGEALDGAAVLAKLIDAQRFPALTEAVVSGAFDDDPDAEFVFGLERVLDGIEALVRARGS
jgi:hypothetical protein